MNVRLVDTLIFNIRAFGWRRGLHLPVYVFSKIKVYSIGRIEITCPLHRNIVSIGLNAKDTHSPYTIWNNMGTIRIGGKVYFHHGCIIKNGGIIDLAGHNVFSHNVHLDVQTQLILGTHIAIGYDSVILDTDHHYTINTETRAIHTCTAPIHIGNYNWFGHHTYIKKGAITPDYTIVASPNALLCKDYSDIAPYSVLGGAPAKVLKQGIRRIYNFMHEAEINAFFAAHPEETTYTLDESMDIDAYCQYE